MASNYDITMRQFNGIDYDTLYPKTKLSQIDDLANYAQINSSGLYLPNGAKSGGILDMNGNKITNVANPVNDNDAVNKSYVDGKTMSKTLLSTKTFSFNNLIIASESKVSGLDYVFYIHPKDKQYSNLLIEFIPNNLTFGVSGNESGYIGIVPVHKDNGNIDNSSGWMHIFESYGNSYPSVPKMEILFYTYSRYIADSDYFNLNLVLQHPVNNSNNTLFLSSNYTKLALVLGTNSGVVGKINGSLITNVYSITYLM